MPRPSDRIPVVTSSVSARFKFALRQKDVDRLEQHLGVEIPRAAVDEIRTACRRYITFRQAEIAAQEKSVALQYWDDLKERLMRIVEVSEGVSPPFDDAGRLIAGMFFDALGARQMQVTLADLEPPSIDPALSAGHLPSGHNLTISSDFLMRLAALFRLTITDVEKEIGELGVGFRRGGAMAEWLVEMHEIATRYGFPHGAGRIGKSRDEASPFACFLFDINRNFPADLRENVNSAPAMGDRLRRALANTRAA